MDWRRLSAGTEVPDEGFVRTEGLVHAHVWEASDPRLSGDVTYTGNWHLYSEHPEIVVEGGTYELVNADGRWLGSSAGITVAGIDTLDPVILTGEGDYEGLSAYVLIDWSAAPQAPFSGLIFRGDMPMFPEGAAIE